MKNKEEEQLSDSDYILNQAFTNWIISTKKIAYNQLQVNNILDNRMLIKEFYLVVKYLFGKNANIEYKNKGIYNYSDQVFNELMHFVAFNKLSSNENENYQIAKSIMKDYLAAGRNLCDRDYDGATPLALAISINNHSFLKALGDQGYDFSALDKHGFPPICLLISQISKGMSTIEDLKIWIENGLSINRAAVTVNGVFFAYDFALKHGLKEVALLLKEHGVRSISEYNNIEDIIRDSCGNIYEERNSSKFGKILPAKHQEALKKYFMHFHNIGANTASLLKVIGDNTGSCYGCNDFLKDFKDREKLKHFCNFVIHSEDLDSSIVKPFEKIVEKIDRHTNVLPGIDESLAPFVVGYLEGLKKYYPDSLQITLNKITSSELGLIYSKQYHRINLHDEVYNYFLNYCAINFQNGNLDHIDAFTKFIGMVGDTGLSYCYGRVPFKNLESITPFTMMSPLAMVTALGKNNFAFILAKVGYGTKFLDCKQFTAVHLAIQYNNIELLNLYKQELGKSCFNMKDFKDNVPISVPLVKQNEYLVKFLIECGADINLFDNDDGTLAHLLAEAGMVESLAIAIRCGADLSIAHPKGYSLYYSAIRVLLEKPGEGNSENVCKIISLLNKQKLPLSENDVFKGKTVYSYLLNNGFTEVGKALVQVINDRYHEKFIDYKKQLDGVAKELGIITNLTDQHNTELKGDSIEENNDMF